MVEKLKEAKLEDYLGQKRTALARHQNDHHRIHQLSSTDISSRQAEEIIARDIGQMRFFRSVSDSFSRRAEESRESLKNTTKRNFGRRIAFVAVAPALILSTVLGVAATGKTDSETLQAGLATAVVSLILGSETLNLALKKPDRELQQSGNNKINGSSEN